MTFDPLTDQEQLEKHLETLFSDVVPPEPGANLSLPDTAPAPAHPRAPKKRTLKPQGMTVLRLLAALAPFVVLTFLLVDQSLARPADAVILPAPTTQAVAQPSRPTATPDRPTTTRPAPSATPGAPTPTWTPLPVTPTPTPAAVSATATPPPTPAPASATPETSATPIPSLLPTDTPPVINTPTPTLAAPTATPQPGDRLLIPAINLEAPVVTVGFEHYEINGQPVTTWAVPSTYAVGWHHTSAPPGQPGNTVINGHQNIYGRVFQNLAAVQAGDEVTLHVGGTVYHYRVAERRILLEEGQPLEVRVQNAQWIMPTQDERLTLVTCSPDDKSTHRLIVVAFPVHE